MNKTKENHQKYDEIPYRCYSFNYCSPETLRTIGTLFGMNPAPLKTARILEIGSSEGYNLFRFAETHPKSFTLGVDLSKAKIERGQKAIEQLKLENIKLEAMSITDIDESYGKFDYIICHCVFSWVPDFVRDSILEVSKKLLNKNGIVFINYNTLPGFNMISSIRELMMFHTSGFTNINDKIQQARLALNFLHESLEGQKTPYADLVREAAENIPNNENYVLCWEYLSEINQPYYLHEFVDKARSCGFEYVGDTDIQKMYVGSLPKKASDLLGTITDTIKLEQYMDFIRNIAFRNTLLCHQGTSLSRNINNDILRKFYYFCNLTLKDSEIAFNLTDNSLVTFYLLEDVGEKFIQTEDPATKAILMTFLKNQGNPLSLDELAIQAKKLVPLVTDLEIENCISKNLANLMFRGYIKFIVDKPNSISVISEKPKISKLAQLQIQQVALNNIPIITDSLNRVTSVADQIHILKYLDGKHTIEQIKQKTLDSLKKGEIVATDNDTKTQIKDEKRLKIISDGLVDNGLESLRKRFCLIA